MQVQQLSELREHLSDNLGMNFTESREHELYRKIGLAAKEFNYQNTDAFIAWITNNDLTRQQIEKLATFLTVGETYFLREKKALNYLEYRYLPDLIYKRRGKNQHLRIWSAGCASGEEAYSVAMMIRRLLPDIKKWNITILATDINAAFLKKARIGNYTKWSFRGVPNSVIKDNFKEIDTGIFQINPVIKDMVTFMYHNLASNTYPSLLDNTTAMDVILCRNVLIYFTTKGIMEVTGRLYNCLAPKGTLLVSPVETSNLISPKFNRSQYNGITIYSKDKRRTKKKGKKIYDWEIPQENNFFRSETNPSTLSTFLKEKKNTFQIPKPTTRNPKTETLNSQPTTRSSQPCLAGRQAATRNSQPVTHKPKPETLPSQNTTTEISEYNKAYSLFKSGLFEEAESILSNVLNYNTKNIKSNITLLAKIKANLGKLDEAKQLCKKAIQIDKLDPGVYYLLATILSEHGKEEDPIKYLNTTLFLDPDFTLAYFLLGRYSAKSGKNAQSRKYYNSALKTLSKLNPEDKLAESDGLTVGRFTEIIENMKMI